MTLYRLWFAVLVAAIVVAGFSVCKLRGLPARVHASVHYSVQTTSVIDSSRRADVTEGGSAHVTVGERSWEPRVDLNGNEIDAAVSDYRLDPRGELYERHAPDTALLHLSAPKL